MWDGCLKKLKKAFGKRNAVAECSHFSQSDAFDPFYCYYLCFSFSPEKDKWNAHKELTHLSNQFPTEIMNSIERKAHQESEKPRKRGSLKSCRQSRAEDPLNIQVLPTLSIVTVTTPLHGEKGQGVLVPFHRWMSAQCEVNGQKVILGSHTCRSATGRCHQSRTLMWVYSQAHSH